MVRGRKMVTKMHKGAYMADPVQAARFVHYRCWRETRSGQSFLLLGHVLRAL
jgi:hypothetical protein